jgi:MFS family permease
MATAQENFMPRFIVLQRALAHRNFRLFIAGQGISLIGTWMQQVGISWLVFRLTGSAFSLGLIGFASQIPTFLLAPTAGVLTDRWDRHRTLLVTQVLAMLQATVLTILVWNEAIEVWGLVALSAVLGMINAFDMPTRQAFLVDMVPRRGDLANAIAINSSMVNVSRLVGPSVAGLLIALGGEISCFLFNAVSYVAVIGALVAMRDLPERGKRVMQPVWKGMTEGIVYAFGFAPIRALLLLVALVSMMAMPMSILLPVFASKLLRGGPSLLGLMTGATGVGALSSAIYLASRRQVLGLGKLISAAAVVLGLSMIGFSLSRSVPLSLAMLVVTGFCTIFQMAASNTLLQTIVDEDKRGRVMSLYVMAFVGAAPFGSLLAGTIADHANAPLAIQVGAAACILGGAAFAVNLPRLREQVLPIYERTGILPTVARANEMAAELSTPPEDVG